MIEAGVGAFQRFSVESIHDGDVTDSEIVLAILRAVFNLMSDDTRLLNIIKEKSLIKDRPFRLASGKSSNYFFDLKPTMLDPEGINLLADAILQRTVNLDAKYLGGLEMGAVPIVVAATLKSFGTAHPLYGFWVRKEQKDHGILNLTDGHFVAGSRVIIVDDVTTTGGSVLKAINEVRRHNCTIAAVITIVDRLEGAKENLAAQDVELIALYTTKDFD